MQNSPNQTSPSNHHHEEILVVYRNHLFAHHAAWHGILPEPKQCMKAIEQHSSFMPRAHAETNYEYKQIIPYVIFMVNQKIFVMQRKPSASEQRLASKFSIGIGGHIRQEDIENNDIIAWANREFDEEVAYTGSKQLTILGMLNDDSNDVGKVHLGLIILLHANSEQIHIKDEHKSGSLLSKDECLVLKNNMENWSQICLDFLIQKEIF